MGPPSLPGMPLSCVWCAAGWAGLGVSRWARALEHAASRVEGSTFVTQSPVCAPYLIYHGAKLARTHSPDPCRRERKAFDGP